MNKIILFLSVLALIISTGCINLDVPLVPLVDADFVEESAASQINQSELAAL